MQINMNSRKLKRCPFCGFNKPFMCTSKYGDLQELHYHVHCGKCGCTGGHDISEEKAIKLWNTRKPIKDVIKELEELKPMVFETDTHIEVHTKKAISFAIKQVINIIKNKLL